jgi:D-threo-aldose 1-dehydrogenase
VSSPAAHRVKLPRVDLAVSRLGFGGAPLGDLYVMLDDRVAIEAVTAAAEAGVALFDTSPLYGHGLSEHRIGTGLRRAAPGAIVSTKVGRVLTPARGPIDTEGYVGGLPFAARFDYSYDGALRSAEQSLQRLGRDRLDILLVHDVDVWTHGPDAIDARFREAIEGACRALSELKRQGLVSAIGVGVNEAAMCARFMAETEIDMVMLAGRHTLLEQDALSFLDTAATAGVAVLLGGVFNSGILATGAVPGARWNYREAPPEVIERVRRIEAACARHGVPLATAAIRFPLAHPAIASVVLGAVTPGEVARNVSAFEAPIPLALWDELKHAGLIARDCQTPATERLP